VARRAPHDRGDEFRAVALPHLDALYNLALSLTRNAQDAEDLVQETYLRAYRFFETYEPGTQIKSWLFRILRNAFINRYRAKKVRPDEVDLEPVESGYEQLIESTFLGEHRPRSPEQLLMDASLDEEVGNALLKLPEEYRTVVLLALVEDLSYKEIASVLAIPIGTVMSRLHRGRRMLQAELLEHARRTGIFRGHGTVPSTEDAS
jgi:RNA polymerase sigma-70 factor (ECF subfamily)